MDKKLDQQLDQKLQQSYQQLSSKAPEELWKSLQVHLMEVEVSLDQQLDERVEASYEQVGATVPVDLWESVEKTLPKVELEIDQQLDDKLKEGFVQQTVSAPLTLWGAIEDELSSVSSIHEELDNKIKNSFEEEQFRAPHKVWAAVNRQLNIDRTWQRISTALDAPVVIIDWKKHSLKGLIIVLLFLLGVKTCQKVSTISNPSGAIATTIKGNTKKNVPIKERKNLLSPEFLNEAKEKRSVSNKLDLENPTWKINKQEQMLDSDENREKNTYKKVQETRLGQKLTAVPDRSMTKEKQVIIGAVGKFAKEIPNNFSSSIPFLEENRETLLKERRESIEDTVACNLLRATRLKELIIPSELLFPDLEFVKEPKWKSKKRVLKSRLSIGVFAVVNSTVLLNNETRKGFDSNSLTINYFGLAANYGLWARYSLGKRGALMAEYSINADHRQAYGVYQKGKFILKEYLFKYNRFSLAYQFDLWRNRHSLKNKVAVQLGAYIGTMRAVNLYYDKVLVGRKVGEYHHYDGGIKIALGHEITINHFVLGYGLRSDIGMANIFKGNKKLKGQQNETNLIHLGAYIHLGYQF